jgi:hypothetical protein
LTPSRKRPGRANAGRRPQDPPAPDGTPRLPSPDAFPHLQAFLSGYLHQDFLLEYPTPAEALQAFLGEASAAERRGLRADWQVFRRAIEEAGWEEVRGLIAGLGGAWCPANRRALLGLFSALD